MKNIELVRNLALHTAVVSYEKILIYPGRFVRQLAAFEGRPDPAKPQIRKIVSFLEPGSYKAAKADHPESQDH